MAGMNRVTLMGHLGMDPVIGRTEAGVPYAGVALRTCERLTDEVTGERREVTEWHRVVVFGGKAELVGETLRRGSPAVFEGRMKTHRWSDGHGVERQETVVVSDEVHLFYRTGLEEDAPAGFGGAWPVEGLHGEVRGNSG